MFKTIRIFKSLYKFANHVSINPKNKLYTLYVCNNYIFSNINSYTNIIRKYCTENVKTNNILISGLRDGVNVEELTSNDTNLLKKLKLIILEIDVMRQEGGLAPDIKFITQVQWKELLFKQSRSQRKKYLEFLFKLEKTKENRQIKKEKAKIERESRPAYVNDGHIRYGLNHNTFFLRIYDTTINHMYNSRLISAMQFGQPLVIDCGYDKNMTNRECANCAKQIMIAFSENRIHDEPFDLHLCNANKTSPTIDYLHRHIRTMYEPWFPLHIHSQSYKETQFPSLEKGKPTKLVYLTPHCREELTKFDHDAVYIIGGIVDKVNHEPLSLARAKSEGLKMARLPLDRYLQWTGGSGKSLTINQMVSILLDVRRTNDWEFALRHVPRRKLERQNSYNNVIKYADRSSLSYDRSASNRTFDNMRNNENKTTKDFIKELMSH